MLKESCAYFHNLKNKADSLKAELDEVKELMDRAKTALLEDLDSEGLQSAKVDGHYFSKTVRHDLRIADEQEVWKYLDANKALRDEVVSEKIDQLRLKSKAKKLYTEEGELIMGMEPVSTVSITVRKA
jgi:hypothetical protein